MHVRFSEHEVARCLRAHMIPPSCGPESKKAQWNTITSVYVTSSDILAKTAWMHMDDHLLLSVSLCAEARILPEEIDVPMSSVPSLVERCFTTTSSASTGVFAGGCDVLKGARLEYWEGQQPLLDALQQPTQQPPKIK